MNDPHLQLILCCLPVVGTSLSAMYEDCCTRDDHTSLIAEGISDMPCSDCQRLSE